MADNSSSTAAGDFAAELAAALPALARLTDRDAALLRLADTAACAIAAETLADASHGTTAEGTIAHIRRHAGHSVGPATIWATGERASVDVAALRNAVAQRYLDYNDTYIGRAVTHPSDMIAALVALAEERNLGWDRLIAAVTVAYEVLCRLADQVQLGDHGFDGSTLSRPLARSPERHGSSGWTSSAPRKRFRSRPWMPARCDR
jgi:2-methylcitrate dehydratase PrpD